VTPEPPLIQCRGLRKQYGGSQQTTALREANIDVAQGDFVAIMGPSGAGKSTLLNVLGLLDQASGGTYLIDGRNARDLPERIHDRMRASMFSFVFQAAHVMPYASVEVNAALGLSIQSLPRTERAQRVQEALAQVGLSHRLGALARELSGGERQRLAIARAIATRPRILFADEPTGNLDAANTNAIMDLLAQLNREGMTIILITHDADVARRAKRVTNLYDGRINATLVSGGALASTPASAPTSTRSGRARFVVERVADALNVLTSRPARTLALVSAFLLGSAGLVAATGIGTSAAQQVSDRLTASALDQVYVSNSTQLTAAELAGRKRGLAAIDGVVRVGLRVNIEAVDANVSNLPASVPGSTNQDFTGQAFGADTDLLTIYAAKTTPPSAASLLDDADVGNVILLGIEAAEALGVTNASQQIWVRGHPFTVVGIITSADRGDFLTNSVVLPASSLPSTPSEFTVQTTPGLPAAIAEAIPPTLNPGNPGEVSVSTVADLRNLRIGVSSDLSTLVGAVSVLLLAMAVLSASTSMFLSVQARAQEIALRRALGLSRRGAVSIFMIEGTIVGAAGGLAGVAIGLVVIVSVAANQEWSAVIPINSLYSGILAGIIGGAIAAVAPSLRASRIEPAEAIR